MNFKEVIEQFNCEKCGVVKCKQIDFGNGVKEPYCPICYDEEQKKEEKATDDKNKKQEKEKAEARRLRRIKSNTNNAKVPKRYKGLTFSDFVIKTQGDRVNLDVFIDYAQNFTAKKEQGTSLTVIGRVGAGKTHLVCSLVNELLKNDYTALYSDFWQVINEIRKAYNDYALDVEKIINRFCQFDLLVVDEVGVQSGTSNERLLFSQLINERYKSQLPTIIVSNLNELEIIKTIGERAYDRLKENGGKLVVFNGESRRSENKI